MPQCTEQLGYFFDECSHLPRLHHAPTLELVDAIKAHQDHQHSTGVVDDTDDHLDLSVDLPEPSDFAVIWIWFVELVRSSSVHQSFEGK